MKIFKLREKITLLYPRKCALCDNVTQSYLHYVYRKEDCFKFYSRAENGKLYSRKKYRKDYVYKKGKRSVKAYVCMDCAVVNTI